MLQLDRLDHQVLEENLLIIKNRFQGSAGSTDESYWTEVERRGLIKVVHNYNDIESIVTCFPKVMIQLISGYAHDEFVMTYNVYNWHNGPRKGINISFENQSFYVKVLCRIFMQKLSEMNNNLNLVSEIYLTEQGTRIHKRLKQIYYKYNLAEIDYIHRVSTPQTDIFNLTVFLYNSVVRLLKE